jgi:hypothetical protein
MSGNAPTLEIDADDDDNQSASTDDKDVRDEKMQLEITFRVEEF